MKITLDLDAYGMDRSEFIGWIRNGLGGEFTKVADDIEAQLPKPTPAEPKGDVVVRLESDEGRSDVWLVRSAGGTGWVELGHTALSFTSWSELIKWWSKWARGPIAAYRPEPSPDAFLALVEESAARLMLDCPRTQGQADKFLSEFARRLLGGDR